MIMIIIILIIKERLHSARRSPTLADCTATFRHGILVTKATQEMSDSGHSDFSD